MTSRQKMIAALLALCVTSHARIQGQDPTRAAVKPVISSLVESLNSKSETTMRRFVNTHMVSNSPIEQRVHRWMGLAESGAPFKVVRELGWKADQATFILTDRLSNRIALVAHFETHPKVMLLGIQLAPAYTQEGIPPELSSWKDLNQLAQSLTRKAHSPAMGIALIRRGVASEAAVGVKRVGAKTSVHVGEVWSVGSIGKPICATVIGRLIEMGKLRWDQTLKQALPDFPMDPVAGSVTLDQLMHHRGGIRPDLGFKETEVKAIIGTAKSPSQIREKYARDILRQKPAVDPGSQFLYSNAGYALLSVVAEKASGKPYEQILKDFIFKPLGLNHSFTGVDKLPTARPSGHADDGGGLRAENASGPMEFMFAGAGGGIFMSLGDLAKFGEAHLQGLNSKNGLLTSKTIKRLHEGFPEAPRLTRIYACGWGIDTLPNMQPFHGHNGSNGTMRAQLAIFPNSDLVIVAAVNRGGEAEPSPAMEAVLAIGSRYAPRANQ